MKKGKVFIISGPSGSGKTTLYKRLLTDKFPLIKSISVTTRPKRPGERHGRDYFFVSLKMFLFKKRAGHFLEWQKVFDNYYGTPNKVVQDLLRSSNNVLLCIDVKGAKVVRRKYSKAVTIFIKTPSLEILRERLIKRGSETPETVDLRLNIARQELKETKNYKYIINNDNLNKAYKELKTIIRKEIDFCL